MFKVQLVKLVWNGYTRTNSTLFASLARVIELPFAPVPGHGIQFGMERLWRLTTVDWDVENQTFRCAVEDQFMVTVDDYFEDLLNTLQRDGWQLYGPCPVS